jgi:uncharacterized Zn finger protein (UPF0148 family)
MSKMAVNQSSAKFCSNCGFSLEKNFCFCPKCGKDIINNANIKEDEKVKTEIPSGSASSSRRFAMPKFSLPSFHAFKAKKETERQNSFSKKSATINKKRKIEDKEVTIQVGVMDEYFKVKRGETIPLKISSTTSAHTILAAAIKKHGDFNRCFDKVFTSFHLPN